MPKSRTSDEINESEATVVDHGDEVWTSPEVAAGQAGEPSDVYMNLDAVYDEKDETD